MLDDIDKNRLETAWNCILDEYFDLCLEKSITDGISVFKFLPKSENRDEKIVNCEFQFIPKDSIYWNRALGPHKEEILKVYDNDHILISVHIPDSGDQNDTIGNIRLFDKTNKTNEIFLNLE